MLNRPIFDGTEQPSDRAWAWQQYVDDRSRFAALGAEEVAAMTMQEALLEAQAACRAALNDFYGQMDSQLTNETEAMLKDAIAKADAALADSTRAAVEEESAFWRQRHLEEKEPQP